MTEREVELTEQLLAELARYLGQQPERLAHRSSLAHPSPTMIAAWTQATRTRNSLHAKAGALSPSASVAIPRPLVA
jgi:hypothetical protein